MTPASLDTLPGRAADYYGPAYGEINHALRAGVEPSGERREVVADMIAAMKPLREDMTLWRGRRTDRGWKVGEVIDQKGFLSASASWRTAQHFSGEEGALFKIRARKGARVVVENETEQEVLFEPGARLRLVEIVEDARNGAHRGYAGPDRVYIMEFDESGG